jgi:hypothetical protein
MYTVGPENIPFQGQTDPSKMGSHTQEISQAHEYFEVTVQSMLPRRPPQSETEVCCAPFAVQHLCTTSSQQRKETLVHKAAFPASSFSFVVPKDRRKLENFPPASWKADGFSTSSDDTVAHRLCNKHLVSLQC